VRDENIQRARISFRAFRIVAVLALHAAFVEAVPLASPTVNLDGGVLIGATDGAVSKILGIPFAKPP